MSERRYPPVLKALKKYYGYDSFRPGQLDLIRALLDGRDVLGVMPTGAGKSVCFQIPAIFMPGITLVISPLISLMKDQVAALIQAGIPTAYLNSSLTFAQYKKALFLAGQGKYKIIYVAPERLSTPGFMNFASKADISMIAVDEAHCVSQWGQNFRPGYLEIAGFARTLPKRPVMAAFTATATGMVRDDIIRLLELRQPQLLVSGFDRKNLFFEVVRGKNKFDHLLAFLEDHPHESGIIYCQTRKETEDIAARLNAQGYPCGRYHAGLSDAERSAAQDDFLYDRIALMTATSAFGMGIDKSNVRFVIHYSMPTCLENYYQEAGRAGRDGAPAHCLLLYTPADYMSAKFLVERSNEDSDEQQLQRDLRRLGAMDGYCRTPMCLRSYILQYFGEATSGKCEGCSNCKSDWIEEDISAPARTILAALHHLPYSYGLTTIADALKGRRSEKMRKAPFSELPEYGALADLEADRIRLILEALLMQGFLKRSSDQWQTISPTMAFEKAIADHQLFSMQRKQSSLEQRAARRKKQNAAEIDVKAGDSLMDQLRALRTRLARQASLPPYMIFSDATLMELVRIKPSTRQELMEISGIGAVKLKKYGTDLLKILESAHE